MVSSISVPESSLLQTSKLPPTSLALSCMPRKPQCPVRPLSLRACSSMPLPSSRISTRNWCFSYRISSSIRRACACRNALRSASPAMRYTSSRRIGCKFCGAPSTSTSKTGEFWLVLFAPSSSPSVLRAAARSLVSIVDERNPSTASRPSVIA
jgi:hypothetical protein